MQFKLYQIFECAALVVSLFCWKKIIRTQLAVFIPFLAIVILYEIGTVSGWFSIRHSNHLAANFFMLFQFSFYIFLLSCIFQNKKIRRVVLLSEMILLLFFFLNTAFKQKITVFNSYTYIFGSLVLIAWSCYLFYHLMTRTVNLKISRYPYFWIFSGVMIFYLFRFVFMSYFTFLAYQSNDLFAQLFTSISRISIVLLYSCISIGLICFNPPLRKI
jgi:hypothetical protein